jgi:hypothetical protein
MRETFPMVFTSVIVSSIPTVKRRSVIPTFPSCSSVAVGGKNPLADKMTPAIRYPISGGCLTSFAITPAVAAEIIRRANWAMSILREYRFGDNNSRN